MKKITFVILIVVLIISIAYYTNKNVLETSPVMQIDFSIVGDFENPVFDVDNTSRTIKMVPIIKQNRNPGVLDANTIICDTFYDQQKIGSNSVVIPYHGSGDYSLTLTFKDDVRLPMSDQEYINVQFMFLNESEVFTTKYLAFRWINSTELQ